ncbi:MAG: sugar phosphate isomerase/epimerase, partial [Planctomycetota bacterium]
GMGDPIEAIETLGFRIAQLHIKDADPARTPGTWGTELPVGTGSVDWARFLETTSRVCPGAAAYIEREAGEQRVRDVIVAREHIASLSKAIA